MRSKYLSGSILAYTLGISIIVSAIITAIILLGYYHRLQYKTYEINQKLDRNVRSAEELALSNPDYFQYFEPEELDLYGTGLDSVMVERRPWGFYDHVTVRAYHGRFQSSSLFAVGYQPDSLASASFFLMDDRRPLSVVGDTKISGVLYLPQSGVQSAFIDRQGYQNDSLFYGEKRVSGDTLPELFDDFLLGWEEIDEYINSSDFLGSVEHSFLNDTLITWNTSKIEVIDTLIGKIYLEAKEIVFSSEAMTKDILARADVIKFESGFQGSGQFLAEDTLVIDGATLEYPTIAFLNNENSVGILRVEGSSKVRGILGVSGDPNLYTQRQLYIEDGALVQGLVYANGYLELYGKISGHVTARKTLVSSNSGVYENYLLNAEIEPATHNIKMILPRLWSFTNVKSVAQWLN
ncbi:MAG: polymer-forming cytoskeletal protein [Bacteroidota bacterium]